LPPSRCSLAHAKGYVIWEPAVSASLNVAFTIAGLDDAVVVTADQVPLVERHGLKKIDDLRGRYTGQTDAQIYGDAYARYGARCTRESIMLMGGHAGAVRMPAMADWGIRQKMFFHDLSANPIHVEEVALNKRLYSELVPLATVFGWHSYAKDTEEQQTTLLSSYGLRMEGLHNLPNLSFNCQFTFTPGFKFKNNHRVAADAQTHRGEESLPRLRAVRQHRHRCLDQTGTRQIAVRLAGDDELDQVFAGRPGVLSRERHAQRSLHRRAVRAGLHVSQSHSGRQIRSSHAGRAQAHGDTGREHYGDHGQLRRRRKPGQRRPDQGNGGSLLRRVPRCHRLHQRLRPRAHARSPRHPGPHFLRVLHRPPDVPATRWRPT
jgi:hypothetical protein